MISRILRALKRPTPRDTEGRFASAARIRVRAKAREMALRMGRDDLAAKLEGVGG